MKKQRLILALAMVAMVAVSANAANTWLGGTGSWGDGTQWSDGTSPGNYPGGDITINSGTASGTGILDTRGNSQVNFGGTGTLNWDSGASHIYVGSNWPANGGSTMTISDNFTLNHGSSDSRPWYGNIEVGNNGDGLLKIEGGTVNMPGKAIKVAGGSSGNGELIISGGQINVDYINNGWDGSGVIRIHGGADINLTGRFFNTQSSQTQWYLEGGVSTIDADKFEMNGGALVVRTAGKGGKWTLATYNSTVGTINTSNVIPVGLLAGQTWKVEQGANALTFSVIPEPATLALLGLGGLVLRRRKK